MLYVFEVGPVTTGEGEMTGYIGLTPEHAFEARFGDPVSALRSFAKESGEKDLRCDPALARAGKAFGYVADEAPAWAAEARAVLAFQIASGAAAPAVGSPIEAFLESMGAFLAAEPWRYWQNDDVIDVAITRAGRTKTYEACVMGAGGLETGLALYPEKGSIARLSRASMTEARTIDSIGVTMEDGPEWAEDALIEAFGVEGVPVPICLKKRRVRPASAEDVATLAAALAAVANLRPRVHEITCVLAIDRVGSMMTVHARSPRAAE